MTRIIKVGAVLCVCFLATALQARPKRPAREARTVQFTATAYCLAGKTASGARARAGMVAADHRVLPMGSVIHVDTPAQPYSGVYTVADGGASVKGRRIDLFIPDCRRARAFGRRRVGVRLLRSGSTP